MCKGTRLSAVYALSGYKKFASFSEYQQHKNELACAVRLWAKRASLPYTAYHLQGATCAELTSRDRERINSVRQVSHPVSDVICLLADVTYGQCAPHCQPDFIPGEFLVSVVDQHGDVFIRKCLSQLKTIGSLYNEKVHLRALRESDELRHSDCWKENILWAKVGQISRERNHADAT